MSLSLNRGRVRGRKGEMEGGRVRGREQGMEEHEEQKEGRETEGGRDWVVRTSRRRRRK